MQVLLYVYDTDKFAFPFAVLTTLKEPWFTLETLYLVFI